MTADSRRRICAWCGAAMYARGCGPTTHGLCSRCFHARMAEVLVPGAAERSAARAGECRRALDGERGERGERGIR